MINSDFVLKGDICYSQDKSSLFCAKESYLVCEDGKSMGVFSELPEKYTALPVHDYTGKLILPGLVDLHMHAPQFSFRGLGMDLELLDWLNTHTFPEESKYADLDYAQKAYTRVIENFKQGPNTRICLFSTLHLPATQLLMEKMECSGLVSMVGKVNMDRNSPDNLRESSEESARATRKWLKESAGKYKNTTPILTPRFIPSCSDDLMKELSTIQNEYKIPVQSHLSENPSEIAWVQELCPTSKNYGDAYQQFGLFGGDVPTIMAHCVWCSEDEIELIHSNGVYVAHCPQSNINLSSGIAPIRKYMEKGINVGLGSDVAGGCHCSMFRAMSDAIQVSKLNWRLVDQNQAPLTVEEAFFLGTKGGGSFFGKVGSFEAGYEFDAIVVDDSNLEAPFELDIPARLARVIYLSNDNNVSKKYVRGISIL